MTPPSDAKIRSTALWYIAQHFKRDEAKLTTIDHARPSVMALIDLQSGELPIVSFFFSPDCFHLLTTRRVLGRHENQTIDIPVLQVVDANFGLFNDFRKPTGTATLTLADNQSLKLGYETTYGSMAPMYYFRYWEKKYPIIDKLRTDLWPRPPVF